MIDRTNLSITKFSVYASIFFLALKILISANFTGQDSDTDGEANLLSYFCDIIIFLFCLISLKRTENKFLFLYVYFAILFFTFSISTILHGGSLFDALKSLSRTFIPFFFFGLICTYFKNDFKSLVKVCKFLVLYVIVLTVFGLLFLPESYNRITEYSDGVWWPAYFSGIHTTTYVLISSFFVVFSLYKTNKVSKFTAVTYFLIVFISVAFGWGVRTTTLSMLVLIFSIFYFEKIRKIETLRVVFFGGSVFSVFLYLYFYFDWETVDLASSGRLSMYQFKLDQLSNNTLLTWIIGNGAGSDLVETDFWWWEAKGAHSDVITFLVEGGIVFLLLFLSILYKIATFVRGHVIKSIVLSLLITSIFSNGFFVRPLALYIVIFSIAIMYVQQCRIRTRYEFK